eukprot:scaffold3403_cov300-Pinguiococcus_pyrenoidosus.AAC.9
MLAKPVGLSTWREAYVEKFLERCSISVNFDLHLAFPDAIHQAYYVCIPFLGKIVQFAKPGIPRLSIVTMKWA